MNILDRVVREQVSALLRETGLTESQVSCENGVLLIQDVHFNERRLEDMISVQMGEVLSVKVEMIHVQRIYAKIPFFTFSQGYIDVRLAELQRTMALRSGAAHAHIHAESPTYPWPLASLAGRYMWRASRRCLSLARCPVPRCCVKSRSAT